LFLQLLFEQAPVPADATAAKDLRAKLVAARQQLLERAQKRYPADFWLNYYLARHLSLLSLQPVPPNAVKVLQPLLGANRFHARTSNVYLPQLRCQIGAAGKAVFRQNECLAHSHLGETAYALDCF
jgi:hypothetical protein